MSVLSLGKLLNITYLKKGYLDIAKQLPIQVKPSVLSITASISVSDPYNFAADPVSKFRIRIWLESDQI